MIKSKRVKWVGHTASMGEMGNTDKSLDKKLKVRDHLGGTGIGGRIILKLFVESRAGGCRPDSSGSG
jgi:hypothetical protein